jgi:molecular chaperone GrpE
MQDQDKYAEQAAAAAAENAAENVTQPTETPAEAAASQATLEEQLAAAHSQLAELQDSFLRAKAEAENLRRRAQEDVARAHKFAIEGFAEAMLPVKDSLEMALQVEAPSVDSLKQGVEMTLRQLSTAFEKGRLVEVLPQAGDKLDPMRHQAMSMVPADQEPNTVVAVLQKGYLISDRLLRPALVTVAQ